MQYNEWPSYCSCYPGSVAGGVADASDNDVVKEVNEVVQEALKDAVEELKDEETEEDEVEIK